MGCIYQPSGVSITDYGRYGCTIGTNGAINVNVVTGGGGSGGGGTAADQTASNASDAQANRADNQHAITFNYLYNGTSWDRARGTGGSQNVAITGTLPAFATTPSFNESQLGGVSIALGAGTTTGGTQRVVLATDQTNVPTVSNDVRAVSQSLSATVGSFIDIPLNGSGSVAFRFAGLTASGATVSYFTSNDATQTPVDVINDYNAGTGARSPTKSTDGPSRVPVAGRTTLRVQVTTGGTGTITVSYNVSSNNNIVDVTVPPAGLAVNEADGYNITLGAKADAANAATGSTAMAIFRQLHLDLIGPNFATATSAAPTYTNGTIAAMSLDLAGNLRTVLSNQALQTTAGAVEPATAASGKITVTSTAVAANTNTTIAAANTSRIAYGIQCAGTAAVNVSETGATLASATFGATGSTVTIPSGSTPPYFSPPIATRTAITAYTGTAQTCVVTEYNR